MNGYLTVAQSAEAEYEIKRSRFIACAHNVSSEDEAKTVIGLIKKRHYNARHNCFAFVIGEVIRYSDDGEPQGTAGQPILEVIRAQGLDRTLVVVTRYFGGVLLGAGGLARAYTAAAAMALDAAVRVRYSAKNAYSVCVPYGQWDKVSRMLVSLDAEIISKEFSDKVLCTFMADQREADVAERITNASDGAAVTEYLYETLGIDKNPSK